MTLAEFIQGLQKFTQIAGDLPVVFHDAETEAETVLHTIGINIDLGSGTAGGSVTIAHGPAPTAPAPAALTDPAQVADPADPTTAA